MNSVGIVFCWYLEEAATIAPTTHVDEGTAGHLDLAVVRDTADNSLKAPKLSVFLLLAWAQESSYVKRHRHSTG